MVLALSGEILVIDDVDKFLVARRIFALYTLRLFGFRSLCRINVERHATSVVQIHCCSLVDKF